MIKHYILCIVVLWIYFAGCQAFVQQPCDSAKRDNNAQHCPILEQIDSLIQLKVFELAENQKQDLSQPAESPSEGYPDMYYEYMISQLDKETPIELEFNEHVKKYIDIFTRERSHELAKMIGLSKLYFPIFDHYLDKYNLPFELKYLAMVESALNPLAVSSSGAKGLWQFKMNTVELVGLEVNSYIDERRDPYKSTEAACKYIAYLYRTFNDWTLVIGAYNGGPGEIRNAIQRSGGHTDFWEIREHLSEQTKNYVPAFIAMNYVMDNYSKHNIVPILPDIFFYQTDTLHLHHALSFEQILQIIHTPIEMIRFLNPMYTQDYIPEMDHPATLILPSDRVVAFLKSENRIFASKVPRDDYISLLEKAGSTENKMKIIHVVQEGEFFHKIAIRYNCSIENIKAWNNLSDNYIYPGQSLEIWIDKKDYEKLKNNSLH